MALHCTFTIVFLNGMGHRQSIEPIKTRGKRVERATRENVCEGVTIGFSFTSDWMRKWRESNLSHSTDSNVKSNQMRTSFK